MLELLMFEWEDLIDNTEYEPVYEGLQAGVRLLEKYYCCTDDTDVYFIAHSKVYDYVWFFSNILHYEN